ncbi:MAG: MobC family plasmid mobilization relaxosome protein [Oscillospiraceae bacterium]|nr:MobC family plasmid mobilization relaxosome protein [Oscillospiraceae bacterium]
MAKEKTTGIYFKVSDKEQQLIEQRMEDAGVSNVSAFIRKMCLNGLIVRLDVPQMPDCSKYLKSASNNLNQIARRFNSGGEYCPQELLDVRESLDNCTELFGQVLKSLAKIA